MPGEGGQGRILGWCTSIGGMPLILTLAWQRTCVGEKEEVAEAKVHFLVFGNVHFLLSSAERAVGFSSHSVLYSSFVTFFLTYFCLGSGDMASFLMTEARQHNTEIRMAVSKVADKMDHLMTKVTESS